MCCRHGKLSLSTDSASDEPAVDAVAAAAASRAVENAYYTLKLKTGKGDDAKVDMDDEDDDPLYESIRGGTPSVKSDTSPAVTPDPQDVSSSSSSLKRLGDPQYGESSDL